jgi:hypothetical protein
MHMRGLTPWLIHCSDIDTAYEFELDTAIPLQRLCLKLSDPCLQPYDPSFLHRQWYPTTKVSSERFQKPWLR